MRVKASIKLRYMPHDGHLVLDIPEGVDIYKYIADKVLDINYVVGKNVDRTVGRGVHTTK